MKIVLELVKSVGILGGIAVCLLVFYAVSVQGLNLKMIIDGNIKLSELIKAAPVLLAVILFIGQFGWTMIETHHKIALADERSKQLVASAEREFTKKAEKAEKAAEKAEKAAEADKNFWNALDHRLRDRRALMDHDEPHYVSAVTDSAHTLRKHISRILETYPAVSGPMRNYALLLRNVLQDFLDDVQEVEVRAETTLKSAGLNRWQLEDLCRKRHAERTKANQEIVAYDQLTRCDQAFEDAHKRWRTRTQTLVQTTATLFELPAPDFTRPTALGDA